jgi:hypothetical protein
MLEFSRVGCGMRRLKEMEGSSLSGCMFVGSLGNEAGSIFCGVVLDFCRGEEAKHHGVPR